MALRDLSVKEQQMLDEHRRIEELTAELDAKAQELAVIWNKLYEIPYVDARVFFDSSIKPSGRYTVKSRVLIERTKSYG